MTKKLTFSIVFMLFIAGASAQWTKHATGLSSSISDYCVVDDNIIWAEVGNSIAYTLDGGVTWTTKELPEPILNNAGGFAAVSATTAYIVVSSGEKGIYKTIDAGDTWVLQPTGFNADSDFPNVIYFWNENEGIAVGDAFFVNGERTFFEIYTTTNGGEQWNAVPNANMPAGTWSYNSMSYYKVRGNSFYFTTSTGTIFKSTDKGLNWTEIMTPENEINGLNFDFKDDNNGVLSFYDNDPVIRRQYATSDGGANWIAVASENVQNVYYVPSKNAYFSSGYNEPLKYSTDDGQTWTVLPAFSETSTNHIVSSNSGTVYVAGSRGNIYVSETDYTYENTYIQDVIIESSTTVSIHFSNNIEAASAELVGNYTLTYYSRTDIGVSSVTVDAADNSIVHLVTAEDLPFDTNIYFSADNIIGTDSYPAFGDFKTSLTYTGIFENDRSVLSIYPNPTNGITNFEFANNNIQKLTISDITGKTIIEKVNIQQNEMIDLSSFKSGIYIIKIQTDNEIFTTKIVKE